jgi:hypothetical protein
MKCPVRVAVVLSFAAAVSISASRQTVVLPGLPGRPVVGVQVGGVFQPAPIGNVGIALVPADGAAPSTGNALAIDDARAIRPTELNRTTGAFSFIAPAGQYTLEALTYTNVTWEGAEWQNVLLRGRMDSSLPSGRASQSRSPRIRSAVCRSLFNRG